jgi:hypothetical protein
VQREVAAPQALIEISHAEPGTSPMRDVCFRLLDLRAAIKSRDITDVDAIRQAASEMDRELEAWITTLAPSWSYATVDASDAPTGTYFQGKRHIYSNPWTAHFWNNWRTLRILANRIILQHEIPPDSAYKSPVLSLIRQFSTEICISTPCFTGSSRRPPT